MKIKVPELALVVLLGASGSGKSTFARQHFKSTEVLSSDFCRGLVADDENDQSATKDAFDVLHYVAGKRLAAGRLTVIDATNVQPEARKPLVALAREHDVLPVAIVLNVPEKLCHERNHNRPDRDFGPHVIRRQTDQLRRSLRGLQREGFRHVWVLSSPEDVVNVSIEREPLWNNRVDEHGPFDIIGDVHGCYDELVALLGRLGYVTHTAASHEASGVESSDTTNLTPSSYHQASITHPEGRKVIFLGDLVDRGPQTPAVLRLVMQMVEQGVALCVPGNHDVKLLRKLQGKNVQITHGLAESLEQLDNEPPEFKEQVARFIDGLISHYVLDDRKLVVAHAGLKEQFQGRSSKRVRDFSLYGETTGETDEFGLPIRYNWAAEYRGKAMVVYGHTPVPDAEWLNRTINVDTGCVFGGKLTALRYPEADLVSVPAAYTYAQPARPFLPERDVATSSTLTVQQQHDHVLDVADVLGKRIISTRLQRNIIIREENAITALEVMSRFAANPQWLIYLPPTMSPSETSTVEGLLEHPAEAFAYYRQQGIPQVVVQEKHMGSRVVVVVCRSAEAARRCFGISDGSIGICYTRTGRRFFDDSALETALLQQLQDALEAANFWSEFQTDWFCLDCELMPWSAKAQELLRHQYAAVGAAGRVAVQQTVAVLQQAASWNELVTPLLQQQTERAEMLQRYVESYRRYCWPVASLADLKLAPFHILASQGAAHVDKNHVWHMEKLAALCGTDNQLLFVTPFRIIDVTNPTSEAEGTQWWEELTARGGEGMVVKPFDFIAQGQRGLVQPAVKCRGKEYLRIIYGPEYTAPQHLERLRQRGLGAKRSLAQREFALGVEGLERFVRGEPLRRVHECVFGVLALESEPVDPRL